MKDKEEVTYVPYSSNFDFGRENFFGVLIPIVDQSIPSFDKIIGISFLLSNSNISFLVTAHHVIKNVDNPLMQFVGKDKQIIEIGTNTLNSLGIEWINHPDLDISAIPIILPKSIAKKIINKHIIQKVIPDSSFIQKGQRIKHLGIKKEKNVKFEISNASDRMITAAMGQFENFIDGKIIIKSPAHFGDSGSPLFLETPTGGAALIGIIIKTGIVFKIKNMHDGEYTGETIAIPIKHAFELIKSIRMKKMVKTAQQKIKSEKLDGDFKND